MASTVGTNLVSTSGCLPNEFRCTNTCVDLVKRCDRKADCPNAEDELDCSKVINSFQAPRGATTDT
uniref:Uncharacterized protein n=1 Tax=Rhodnius prolixus TaxID=13249 RepID=T1IEK6_RHOPR